MTTSTSTQWQLSRDAATRYEQIVVPNLVGPFARALVDWVAPPQGATVVDVGCGTGAAARFAAERVGSAGRVIGVDVNAGMIAEAKSLPAPTGAAIEWHEQSAYNLPIPDESADVILAAQMLQFLQDRVAGLKEMYRTLKPGGTVAVSVWCAKEENPYFLAQVEAISRHIGDDAAAGLRAGLTLTQADTFRELLEAAGFVEIDVTIQQLDLPLPNLQEFIPRHISATPLVAAYRAAPPLAQQAVIDEMITRLADYQTSRGATIPFRSTFARARK